MILCSISRVLDGACEPESCQPSVANCLRGADFAWGGPSGGREVIANPHNHERGESNGGDAGGRDLRPREGVEQAARGHGK